MKSGAKQKNGQGLPERHNLHLLLPKRLYTRVRAVAKREKTTVTALVVEALKKLLRERKEKK